MSENQIITVPEERTLKTVAFEIRTLHAQAQQVVLGYAIEIGRRLTEAKGMVSHGEWGKWLEEEVSYSKSTANNFMRIFDAYGADQQSLFGPEAKSQTLGNLPYTKALRLLAIPEEEREEFVEANNVEELSVRDLDKLIRERDEERKAREAAERREKETAELLEAAKAGQETLQAELNNQNKELEQQLAAAKERALELESEARNWKATADTAKEKLAAFKKDPSFSKEVMDKVQQQAFEAAKKAAEEDVEKAKAAADQAVKAHKEAEQKIANLEQERSALEKKLALADADTVLFKASFEQLQEAFNKCRGCLMKVEASNPETAEKLKKAVTSVLDSMKERV